MKTIKLTVGEAVVKFLDNQYVSFDGIENKFIEGIYTIFGHGCVLGIGEALSMVKHNLKVYQGKNEQGMAQCAIAYAKQNNRRKIIPCVSSIGPGAANMVTAAATATVNNLPLLLFPGDTFASRQPDPVLQQLEQPYDLNITTNDAFRPVSRYFDRIIRPEMLMSSLMNAMRVLLDPSNTGAVVIAMPQDVQGESYEYPECFFVKRVHKIYRPQADINQVIDCVKEIIKYKKPLMIIGGGARYSEAGDSIIKLSQRFNIPVCETQAGKSTIESNFPLNLGGIGVTGNSSANDIAKETDLIIGLGTRFSDFTTASKSLYPNAKVITVNLSKFHAEKIESMAMIGDVKAIIEQLYNELIKTDYKTSYKDEINIAREKWQKEMKRLSNLEYCDGFDMEVTERQKDSIDKYIKANGGTILQTSAISLIRETIPKDAIIVGASGSLPGCLQRMWTTEKRFSYNMEYGYSCMGYEIAGAFGSKLACPDREVYAFVGDGSYLMLHSEMVTAIQEGVKINILLFDNGGFGCINNLQMGQGIDSLATEFRKRKGEEPLRDGDFIHIDYAMSAKAYGFKTYTAKNMKELKSALIDSLKQDLPTLIDIKVLPKSMTHGYGGWWNVGCVTLPRNEKQKKAYEDKQNQLKIARKF